MNIPKIPIQGLIVRGDNEKSNDNAFAGWMIELKEDINSSGSYYILFYHPIKDTGFNIWSENLESLKRQIQYYIKKRNFIIEWN